VLLGARELSVSARLSGFRPLSVYVGVRQGVVTGADSVFIRPWREIARSERGVYRSFLPDRQIFRYQVPRHTDQGMFYPFVDGKPVDAEMLEAEFPRTWEYLASHRDKLEARRTVRKGEVPWWRPTRPRDPRVVLGPKIVCPHLMLTPRFALDLAGRYVVTRSPFIHPLLEGYEEEVFLKVMCGILNSSVTQWYMSKHAYKYRGGYNRVEVPLLRSLPVPDPAGVNPAALNRILTLVDRAVKEGPTRDVEIEIDNTVMGMYDLSERERREIAGRWNDA
jgi:TaqI-like C-terminal specificity domain